MTCAHCGYASARFEPFTFLQLPLPEESDRNITICFTPSDGSSPHIKCSVRIPKSGTIRDVCVALVATLGGKKDLAEEDENSEMAAKCEKTEDEEGGEVEGKNGTDDGDDAGNNEEEKTIELDINNLAVAGIHSHYVIGLVSVSKQC
jgi:hypothetical protein